MNCKTPVHLRLFLVFASGVFCPILSSILLYCSFLRDECIIACIAWITDNKIILIAQGLECSKLYLWSRPSCPRWTRHWIVSSCNWWLRPHDEYWSTLDILRHQHWKIGQQSHWHQCSSSAHMCTGLFIKIKGWPRKIMLTAPEYNWNVHTTVGLQKKRND